MISFTLQTSVTYTLLRHLKFPSLANIGRSAESPYGDTITLVSLISAGDEQ